MTHYSQPVSIQPMSKADNKPGTRGGKLKAKPIMVYPSTPAERKLLEKAAALDNRKLSPYIMLTMLEVAKAAIAKAA